MGFLLLYPAKVLHGIFVAACPATCGIAHLKIPITIQQIHLQIRQILCVFAQPLRSLRETKYH